MTFADEVKEELLQHVSQDRGAQQAGLAALLLCVGTFSRQPDGALRLELQTDDRRALTKCFTLFQKTANITAESRGEKENGPLVLSDVLPQTQVKSLAQLCGAADARGTLLEKRDLSRLPLRNDKAVRSFLRNLFLCLGTLGDPAREYQLGFACPASDLSSLVLDLFLGRGIPVKLAVRKKSRFVYTRDAAVISDILSLLGAHGSLLKFENFRVVKQVRGEVNRQVNCEAANIQKTVAASGRQIEDIRFLMERSSFAKLPENLQEMAKVRLAHPELSLTELGALLNPPVGKSGVNHRLRRLSELAEEERSRAEDEKEGGV